MKKYLFKNNSKHKLVEFWKLSNDNTVYVQINSTNKKKILYKDFDLTDYTVLKKNDYQVKLNQWYGQTKETWEYNGETFRNLDNFESNLDLKKIPLHDIGYHIKVNLVYYRGSVYYLWHQYDNKGVLLKLDKTWLKYIDIKNCSPIINCKTKIIQ